jgi:hypothetical protein
MKIIRNGDSVYISGIFEQPDVTSATGWSAVAGSLLSTLTLTVRNPTTGQVIRSGVNIKNANGGTVTEAGVFELVTVPTDSTLTVNQGSELREAVISWTFASGGRAGSAVIPWQVKAL